MDIFNRKWCYKLSKSDTSKGVALLDDNKINDLFDKLIVAYTPPEKFIRRYPVTRVYSAFDSFYDYKKYINKFQKEDICFHEIIPGDVRQKMRYDLDMVGLSFNDAETVKDFVLEASYITMKDLHGIELSLTNDILIFTSHSDKKMSYHIVIDNYFFRDNIQCKLFFKHSLKYIPTEMKCYIDNGVYNSMQSFRIVGSTKPEEYRPKIFCPVFSYKGNIQNHSFIVKGNYDNLVLGRSLLSFTHDCKFLRIENVIIKTYYDYGDLQEDVIRQIEQKIDNNFKLGNAEGNIIPLIKKGPYYCQICCRNHESENPFLIVEGGTVYWCCRRSGGRRIHIFNVLHDYDPVPYDPNPSFDISFDDILSGPGLGQGQVGPVGPVMKNQPSGIQLLKQNLSCVRKQVQNVKIVKYNRIEKPQDSFECISIFNKKK